MISRTRMLNEAGSSQGVAPVHAGLSAFQRLSLRVGFLVVIRFVVLGRAPGDLGRLVAGARTGVSG